MTPFFCACLIHSTEASNRASMATSSILRLLLPLFLSFLIVNRPVLCDNDEEDNLLKGINSYRSSLNLKTLTKNENAECLADKMAEQFKNQPCTNTTGSATVPGTEPQFANYPDLLAKCHLNASDTRDGAIMPACVPKLDPSLVLTNFTRSQYSENLNDTKFTGVGIGSEDNWIVVVLTTSTPEGGYANATPDKSTGFTFKIDINNHLRFLIMVMGCVFLS